MEIVEDRMVRQVRILTNPQDPKGLQSAQNKLRVIYGEDPFVFSSAQTKDGRILISALSV